MLPIRANRPLATATIEPSGPRRRLPREHTVKVTLGFSAMDARYADKRHVVAVAKRSLEGCPRAEDGSDRRAFADVSATRKVAKMKTTTTVVVGLDAKLLWPDRPSEDAIEHLRDSLQGDGYQVRILERRECAEPDCPSDAMVDWSEPSFVPTAWYSDRICGRHNYRVRSRCKSVFVMTSTSAAGQASAVYCSVCGKVLVEWGASKIWVAELVKRGPAGT